MADMANHIGAWHNYISKNKSVSLNEEFGYKVNNSY